MTLRKTSPLWLLLAVNALAGCPDETDETLPPPITSSEAAPSASAAPLEPASVDPSSKIPARIKVELDGRKPDATAGTALSIAGAAVSFTAPKTWKATTNDGYRVATSADDKARFAANSYGAGEDPAGKLDEAATALGLTACEWASPQSASVGKDALPATVADGLCKRNGGEVKAGYAIFASERVLSMGSWDEGGDDDGMFETFRTITKPTGGGSGIAACCSALRGNAAVAPPEQKGAYLLAAGACQQIVSDPRGRAALAGVRSMLKDLAVPDTCR